jgi:vacuolar-type H+-ATPase subunit E/Vma4
VSPTKKEETEDKANYILQHIRNKMIKITDKAKKELSKALNEYPGKMLRIIFAGFG